MAQWRQQLRQASIRQTRYQTTVPSQHGDRNDGQPEVHHSHEFLELSFLKEKRPTEAAVIQTKRVKKASKDITNSSLAFHQISTEN